MNYFLFGIDLEDFRRELINHDIDDIFLYKAVYKYLDLLDRYKWKATFFTVGKDAIKYRELIQEIILRGHEIGCHSFSHETSMFESKNIFTDDLRKNIDALSNAGVGRLYGYRSPQLSFTKENTWVYKILEDNGFIYSSSVLPASSPLYGWEEFGSSIKRFNGIHEIPVSVAKIPLVKEVPYAGGIYFRILPKFLIKRLFNKSFKNGDPVVGYFHPQDISPNLGKLKYRNFNLIYSQLLQINIVNNLDKLNDIFNLNLTVVKYKEYVLNHLEKND